MLREKDRVEVYKVAVNAALGSFLFGYELVNISSLQQLFRTVNNLDSQQNRTLMSIITAALPLSAILGAALLTKLVKYFKGRYLMIYMDILAVLGICVQDISLSFWPLFLGRLILGFVVGINSGLVAQYTFSVTPNTLSGSVGALRQVFLNVGVAMGYTLGFLIDPNNKTDKINWRILISLPILTCTIRATLLLTILTYEIPLHRTKSKKIQRMQKYYYKIYENYADGNQTIQNATQIQKDMVNPLQQPLNQARIKRNLMICIVLAFSNQFCGMNAIIFYAKQLFMRITDQNNNLSQIYIIVLGLVQIVATFVGGKMMDKWPKRYFLLIGELAMVFILVTIFFGSSNVALVVTLIFLHSIAYSFSIGQLLLYYASRMLETTGFVVMINWFATFLIALSAEFMMKNLGFGNSCLIFCILLSTCIIIIWKFLPTQAQIDNQNAVEQVKNISRVTNGVKSEVSNNEIDLIKVYCEIDSQRNMTKQLEQQQSKNSKQMQEQPKLAQSQSQQGNHF